MNSFAASVECSVQPLDFSFHPRRPTLLSVACVDGSVEVHDFQELIDTKQSSGNNLVDDDDDDNDDEIDTILSSSPVHTQLLPSKASDTGTRQASCRAVLFAENGNALYSGGTAGDLARLDVEIVSTFAAQSTPRSILWRVPDASYNKSPIHVLHEIKPSGLVVTGDDAGGVRLWDPRLLGTRKQAADDNSNKTLPGRKPHGCVFGWKEHSDYISAIEHSVDGMTVLAASADCTLSAYDLRMAEQALQKHVDKEKIVRRSDDQEDELLSLKIIKNGKKVVCGTAEGILAVWSWGTWGDISDRFPGHPATVDALEIVDQDTLLTGSSDGLLRVVSIHPDKFLGVLGDHGGFPIEKLEFNADRNFVGSLTHDNFIRLWDARILQEDYEWKSDDGDAGMAESALPAAAGLKTGRDSDDEWEDMDEDMDSNEDSSDEDEDDVNKHLSKNEQRKGKLKTENEKFFEDL